MEMSGAAPAAEHCAVVCCEACYQHKVWKHKQQEGNMPCRKEAPSGEEVMLVGMVAGQDGTVCKAQTLENTDEQSVLDLGHVFLGTDVPGCCVCGKKLICLPVTTFTLIISFLCLSVAIAVIALCVLGVKVSIDTPSSRDTHDLKDAASTLNETLERASGFMGDINKAVCLVPAAYPADWLYYRRSCYYLTREEKDWDSSQSFCLSRNASLVVIDSREELDFLLTYFSETPLCIGLHNTGGQFQWVTGASYDSLYQVKDIGDGGDCAYLNSKSISVSSCVLQRIWMCEKQPYQCG